MQFRKRKVVLLIVIISISWMSASAQNQVFCDSLIKKGVVAMFDKKYTEALELLTQAKTMAEEHRWYHQLFLAKNNTGLTYYMMAEYGDALDYFQESYNIAIENLEPKDEMIVLNNIAILYIKEKDFSKAIDHFKRAYDIATENDIEVKRGLYGVNLGLAYNEIGELKQARTYLIESLPHLKENPEVLLRAEIGIADNDLLAGNFDASEKRNKELIPRAEKQKEDDKLSTIYVLLAKVCLKKKKYDEGIEYTRKALLNNERLESKKVIYEIAASIFNSKGDYLKAVQYKDSLLVLQDTLNQIKNAALFQNSKVKFELQNYQHEGELNKQRLNTERKIFYSVIALIIFSISALLRIRTVRHRQKMMIEERSKKIVELELAKEKSENLLLEKQMKEKETLSLLEQERLKNEIETKNRELSAKALYLSGKNQLIEEIVSTASRLPDFVQNEALMQPVKALRNQLKTDQEWDSFITHFEQINHGLLAKLKNAHPSLTANDIRFISYIYMNMLPKEIASMLNITAEAFRKRKERIAKKMNLDDQETLYDYLSTL